MRQSGLHRRVRDKAAPAPAPDRPATRPRPPSCPTPAPQGAERSGPETPEAQGAQSARPGTFSIFFPMYNERDNIHRVLDHAEEVVPALGFADYEILVVDDGSRDGCGDLVAARAADNGHLRLVRHGQNRGYGAALRTGFQSAGCDVVFYTDSDLPVDLRELERALPLLDDADLVIGYRIDRHETLRRAVYSRIYNRLMRVLFGVRVRDVNFSFKLVRRHVLERIQLTAGTVFIDGQLLAEAQRHGFRIAELPIEYRPREIGVSSFDSPKVALKTLAEMLRYRLRGPRL